MYSSKNFNRDNLFQKLNGWYNRSTARFKDVNKEVDENDPKVYLILQEKHDLSFRTLFIHANSIILKLKAMKFIEKKFLEDFNEIKPHLNLKERQISVSSPLIIEYTNRISPIFSSISFIQNKILPLIGKEVKVSVPPSLNRFIKGGTKKYNLPVQLFRIIRRYWTTTGKIIKNYRDTDQHHFSLIKGAFIINDPNEQLKFILPDNPEVKKIEELTYYKDIDAYKFLMKLFSELHQFIEEISEYFGYERVKLKDIIPIDKEIETKDDYGTVALLIENHSDLRSIFFNVNEQKITVSTVQTRESKNKKDFSVKGEISVSYYDKDLY